MVKKQYKKTARTLIPTYHFIPFFTSDIIPVPPVIQHFSQTSSERAVIPRNHFEPNVKG
jgi:hypothetical protein